MLRPHDYEPKGYLDKNHDNGTIPYSHRTTDEHLKVHLDRWDIAKYPRNKIGWDNDLVHLLYALAG